MKTALFPAPSTLAKTLPFCSLVLLLALTACGTQPADTTAPSPNSSSALKGDASAQSDAKSGTLSAEEAARKSKESVAEQQANIRRDIALRKEKLSTLQNYLSRRTNNKASIEARISSVESQRAGTVAEPVGTSIIGSLINQDYGGAIATGVNKRTNAQVAVKTRAQLAVLSSELQEKLVLASEGVAELKKQIADLDQEIVELNDKLNELAAKT